MRCAPVMCGVDGMCVCVCSPTAGGPRAALCPSPTQSGAAHPIGSDHLSGLGALGVFFLIKARPWQLVALPAANMAVEHVPSDSTDYFPPIMLARTKLMSAIRAFGVVKLDDELRAVVVPGAQAIVTAYLQQRLAARCRPART